MNRAATLGRVFGVVSVGLLVLASAGCAGTASSGLDDSNMAVADEYRAEVGAEGASTDIEGMTSAEFTQLPESMPNENISRMLVAPGSGAPGIELVDGNGFNRLVIQSESADPKFKVSRLTGPDRLVVDLLDTQSRISRNFDTQDSEFVSRVRIGAHPEMSRVVMDLASDQTVAHEVTSGAGLIVVTLATPETISMAAAGLDLNTMARMPIEDPSARAEYAQAEEASPEMADKAWHDQLSGEESAEGAIVPVADKTVTEEPAPVVELVEEVAPPTEMRPRVKGVSIETINGADNMVVADMESAGYYDLKRTAPSEYVLTLEDATLEPEAAMTLVSPAGNGQIRSVRPIVQGNNVLLRIFTTPEATLKAEARSNRIMISAASPNLDMRGQLAPEKEKAADAAAADTTTAAANDSSGEILPIDAEVSALLDEPAKYTGRLISLDLQDTDIDNALRIIAEVSNLNIIASDDVTGKVTLRLIDVPWDQALDVILKTNGLDKVQEGNVIRIAPVEKLRQEREALKQAQQAEEELEPLSVRYMRVSYAKAAELKPLIESVITERGTVAYDERTNQLIVKDIHKGVRNVAELVSKLDLRTPQVLLETQIVEAQRNLTRDLGSELGFQFIQSPETGNATGYNFPNSAAVGGSVVPGQNVGSSFPAAISSVAGSAVSFLFDSADGSKTLDARISALEQEGNVRVISRPAVATTNNKQAIIKSVEKIRVKTPSGGLSVATGSGAQASGSSAVATEVIEIGITLEVTPQASPDYFVLLDINAKSSNFGTHEVEGIPSEVERSATSTVLVSSGQTFALGGIYKISTNDNVAGVPFFKDIPVLGHLFRNQLTDGSDEELLFFITPRIVEGSFDDAAMKATS